MTKQKISFDCLKCLKNLQLEEHIFKKAYEGHELCLSCRSLQESDKKIAEIKCKFANDVYFPVIRNDISVLLSELERLQQDREKLIEGIKWYTDNDHYEMYEALNSGWTNDVSYHGADHARIILKSIGVTDI